MSLTLPADFSWPADLSPEDTRLVLTAGLRTLEFCRGLAAAGIPAGEPALSAAAAPVSNTVAPPLSALTELVAPVSDSVAPPLSAPTGLVAAESAGSPANPLRAEVAELTRRIDVLLGTSSGGATSSLKGAAAERAIESLLLRRYPAAELDVCGKTPGRADFLLRREGAPSLLIEVKNVARVTTAEIEKFERDLGNSGVADGGIFVSCPARPLPRIGPFGLRLYPGAPPPDTLGGAGAERARARAPSRPAIFVVDALATPAHVEFAVALLDFLVPTLARCGAEGGADSAQAAQEVVNRAYSGFLSTLAPLRRIRDRLTLVGLDVQGLEATAAAGIADHRQLWDRHPELRAAGLEEGDNLARLPKVAAPKGEGGKAEARSKGGASSGGIGSERCELAIREFIAAAGRNPVRSEVLEICEISDSVLRRLGGSRVLVARALSGPNEKTSSRAEDPIAEGAHM